MKSIRKEKALTLSCGNAIDAVLHCNPRARRYILRVAQDGSATITVPRSGSQRQALLFAKSKIDWIEEQRRQAKSESGPRPWKKGDDVLYRGRHHNLELDEGSLFIHLADLVIPLSGNGTDLRPCVETFLRNLSAGELPILTREFAARLGLRVGRISVRNQKSRWGSCSIKGNINLNWRLVQTPETVRDYIILHELMHLKQMNHSQRFWNEVEKVCPDYRMAEAWLRANSGLLRS